MKGKMNMVDCPKVTVIIPCYNMGQYIDEAVDSVFAQTMQNFEIIIVDDGSTDQATTQLLSNYHRPNTRVLVTENQGLAAARNHAIRHANGEYLCALDSDDKLHPTYFEHATSHWMVILPDIVSSWVQCSASDALWKRCLRPPPAFRCTVMTPALVAPICAFRGRI